ncbi:MAG: flavin reductase family protein [Mycobacterium sp.]|nr:flavin reductase family protein [Mycobacterium sp.]
MTLSTVSGEMYRAALRRHPAGVAVITLMSGAGPVGFTATSLVSLSLDPPLVSFNITRTSSSIAALRRAASVVVHLIGEHQLEVARRFSRTAQLRFADPHSWSSLDTGEPVLAESPTWLRTQVQQLIDAGDSILVIGRVTRIHCDDIAGVPPRPLVYHNGTFSGTSELSEA